MGQAAADRTIAELQAEMYQLGELENLVCECDGVGIIVSGRSCRGLSIQFLHHRGTESTEKPPCGLCGSISQTLANQIPMPIIVGMGQLTQLAAHSRLLSQTFYQDALG